MFNRINLVSRHCSRLNILTHLDTGSIRPDLSQYPPIYGLNYRRGKTPHIGSGVLRETSTHQRHHVEVEYRVADWGKPPSSFANPDVLSDVLEQIDSPLDWSVTAVFEYPTSEWSSGIAIPWELPNLSGPFTHVEALTLSKHDGDSVEYSLEMRSTSPNEIRHLVTVQRTATFSGDLIEKLLAECTSVSLLAIEPIGALDDK